MNKIRMLFKGELINEWQFKKKNTRVWMRKTMPIGQYLQPKFTKVN